MSISEHLFGCLYDNKKTSKSQILVGKSFPNFRPFVLLLVLKQNRIFILYNCLRQLVGECCTYVLHIPYKIMFCIKSVSESFQVVKFFFYILLTSAVKFDKINMRDGV